MKCFLPGADERSTTCNLHFCNKTVENSASTELPHEEEQTMQWQIEEDLRLYGSRPEPADSELTCNTTATIETLKASRPTDSMKRRSPYVSESTNAFNGGSTNALRNTDSIDSPLSAWLDQSASAAIPPLTSLEHPEIEELKVFRNVHLNASSDLPGVACTPTRDAALDLELPVQIYHRNITDRYPRLPSYLARRLAEANHDRAKRLSYQRTQAEPTSSGTYERTIISRAKPVTSRFPARISASARQKTRQQTANAYPTYSYQPNKPTRMKTKAKAHSYASYYQYTKPENYWTGTSRARGPKSVDSRSSSRNSSLHGHSAFAYQKQYQNMYYSASQDNDREKHLSDPGLPLPSVKLRSSLEPNRHGKKQSLSFECDICGEKVRVNRRREWQYVTI